MPNEIKIGPRIHGYGSVVREYALYKPSKTQCVECRDDHYNIGGHECWSFKDSKVVDKTGHSSIHVEGGPDTKMVKTLSCWHSVQK